MTTAKFVQIHFLTSYPASLLNRDDAGFAKRMPFGGAIRTRVSSQCLKRHWRTFEGDHALSEVGVEGTIRSRLTFDEYVYKPLVGLKLSPEVATQATVALMEAVLGKSDAAKKKDEKAAADGDAKKERKSAADALQTNQVTVLGKPELDYLVKVAAEACQGTKDTKEAVKKLQEKLKDKEFTKNLKALKAAGGLGSAMFGRMLTGDVLARGDAAVHVAHAFTVHEQATESDYFSAVDDLADSMGGGHIGNTELASGLFYGYVVIDVPLLVSNLSGCDRKNWEQQKAEREIAAKIVERLVHLVATVSPGAKLGSTAPYSFANTILVEAGNSQPRSLANAFLAPVAAKGNLGLHANQALVAHAKAVDAMYGYNVKRAVAALGDAAGLRDALRAEAKVETVPAAAEWLGNLLRAN